MSWYSDIKAFIANNITTNHARAITGAKMNTVLNDIVDEVDGKVDKVSGKGLSTNDYNNTEKAKVANAYSKPSGGIPKTDLSSAVQTSLGKADTAVQTETDPTVPSWAKAQTKPAYTASEVGAIPDTDKGANGGVATLDSGGKVPQSQLPSYVDDVLEYANLASFPATGESGKIYVALDTNKTYRWSGSAYVEISESLALGETSSTAFAGDRGKAIEDKIPSNASSSNKLATKTESVPAGGTTGQVLAKKSNTDNDLEWVNQSGGGGGSSNYNDLANKPSINNVTLSGNKTAAQLGLQTELTIDATPTANSTNPVQSGGMYVILSTMFADGCLYGGIVSPQDSPTFGDDHRYFYIAKTDGMYVNFNNYEVDGYVVVFSWNENTQNWRYVSLCPNGQAFDDLLENKADKVSGATVGDFAGLDADGNLTDSGNKASDFATSAQGGKADTAVQPGDLATVATSGSYNDLLNKPTIPAAQVQSDWNEADNTKVDYIKNKPTIPDVSGKADKVSNATSGNFAGLDANGNLTDSGKKTSDFATASQGAKADTAYQKPSSGIPESDLSSDVQQALQKHFKGWYASSSALPANPVVGDYAYVKGATASDPVAIYECTTNGSWSDSGRTVDTSNVQTFRTGEEVNETAIDDTHLDNPQQGSIPLASDVKDRIFNDSAKTALINIFSKVAFIDEHGQEYIDTLYRYLFPNIVSINAVFTQGQAIIYEDDELVTLKQYLVVTALYQDGTTLILLDNAYTLSGTLEEGQSTITATYGDKSDTFTVTVTATPREQLFGVFTNGYAVEKSQQSDVQRICRNQTAARATTKDPCVNQGYTFTVTDSSKYNIAAYDVENLKKQTTNVPSGSVDGYYYIGGSKSIAWKTADSVTTQYCWIALKKMDGTAFTAEELADGAAAVFTYTKSN